MSRLYRILLLILFMIGGLVPCFAAQPQRVAILPVEFHSSQRDAAVSRVIEKALTDRFRTPLAGIVPVYFIVAPKEIAPISAANPAKGKSRLSKDSLATMAEKLNADIVMAAEVSYYYSYVFAGLNGDWYRQTNIEIRLLSYNKSSGEFVEKKDHDYYNGEDTLWAQPDYIARQQMTALLAKMPNY